jgi:multisubunit Na+/H+ antiporter MnhB subunit
MLSGIQEILVIVVILLAILFIPRMMSPKRPPAPKPVRPMRKIRNLGVWWRIAIVASVLWLLGAAVYCRPWAGEVELYIFCGAGPVIVGWCVTWIVAGLRLGRKN